MYDVVIIGAGVSIDAETHGPIVKENLETVVENIDDTGVAVIATKEVV